MTPAIPAELEQRVRTAAGKRVNEVDWEAVNRAGLAASGLPTPVTGPAVAAAVDDDSEIAGKSSYPF